jgi:hypothetical protein
MFYEAGVYAALVKLGFWDPNQMQNARDPLRGMRNVMGQLHPGGTQSPQGGNIERAVLEGLMKPPTVMH